MKQIARERFETAWLSNPEIFSVHELPDCSDHAFYATMAEADADASSLVKSLDGAWKAHFAMNPSEAPDTLLTSAALDETLREIQVPCEFQMEAPEWDPPHYVNTQYPWDGHEALQAPQVSEVYNPTVTCIRHFSLSLPQVQQRTVLHLAGVEAAVLVYVNGHEVGYAEDSFTPHRFDLTPYVHVGENRLALRVFKRCTGSWMEDQDFWRFSGIHRSVSLHFYPETHLYDLRVRTPLTDNYTRATLETRLRVMGASLGKAKLTLTDKAGKTLWTAEKTLTALESYVSAEIPGVKLWSAEEPNLYTLTVVLTNAQGQVTEVCRTKVGFRQFEMKDKIMCLNGKRIVFKGANRHEFSSITGRAVGVHTHEELLRDIITMKQNNINAIRTSHYQNQDALYDLCDEYGLYLIAENNLESHGTWDIHQAGIRGIEGVLPNDKPEWKAVMFDRMNSTYQRDKNHPAVLIWSLGNESFGGETLLQMAEMVHRFDDTRLVHYEGVVNDPRFLETTDIESHMYSTVKDIKEYLAQGDKRPYIECEYSHAMGNSNGALYKYTELADQKDCGYQGGFIWDYIDQSIWKKDRYGKWFQAYGGDFGERPTDYNFSGNGIAYGGDRAPSPKMQEVKFCYQNIAVSIDNSGFEVWNKNLFTSTDAFDCVALLHRDGKLYQQQELTNIDVAPEERSSFPLPFMVPALPGEYAVTISFRLKEDTSWAKKGHEVAFGQGVIAVVRSIPSKKVTPFTVTHGTHNIGVRGENFDVLFSDLNGGLTSYRYAGKEMIQEIPRPNFWRAPTDNDCGNNMGGVRGQWKLASLYATAKGIGKEIPSVHGGTILQNPTCEVEADSVVVTYLYNLQTSPAAECSLQYRVFGDGRIQTTLHYDPVEGLAAMPEFGVLFKIDADYDTVEWYGNGPAETYWDRQHGAKLGIYQNKVADNMAQYLVPQECGAKTAVRWAKVVDRKGRGLLFTADAAKPMFFSALPYTPHEMESAKHPYELPPVHYTVIRAIGEQMGVGGDDSWGANVHPEYIPDVTKPVEFTFTFRGI